VKRALLVLFVSLCGCGSDADFAVKYAPDFRRDGRTVSVFGVYKDGRMSADAWGDVAPRLAGALGGGSCDAAYSAEIVSNDRALAGAIDDQARSDGVTDEMLDLFGPATDSDAIVVFTVAGQTPKDISPKGNPVGSGPSPGGPPGRTGGHHSQTAADPAFGKKTHDAFELGAAIFSTREHRTVGLVTMTYTGKSTDEAFTLFANKLRAELPAMRCGGWKRDVKVDADRVRAVRPAE
jgi:hypothetical protein